LIVPVILFAILPVILNTLQEVLVKALYQFHAEKEIAGILAARPNPQRYPTWEDLGGRIGMESKTTGVSWVAILGVIALLGVRCVASFFSQGGLQSLFRIT